MIYGLFDKAEVQATQKRMERNRSAIDQYWSLVARLVYPEMDGFNSKSMKKFHTMRHPGEMGTHDPYAALALDDGVSVAQGFVTPHGKRYQKLALPAVLMDNVANQQWVEDIEELLFEMRDDPESGFVQSIHQSFMSLYAFSAQSMWVDARYDPMGQPIGLRYESEFIGEIYWERDSRSGFMRIHRKFSLTAEQALHRFKDDAPKAVKGAVKDDNKSQTFEFIHVIAANEKFDPERIDAMGKPIKGCYYICGDDDEVFLEGGYNSMPRIGSVFTPTATSDWGYSPTMRVLPQILRLQEIDNDRTIAAELRLLPAFLAADDELDGAILDMTSGGITHGGLDERGNAMYQPIDLVGDATDALNLVQEARAAIDKAYGRDLLQINRELKTHITATRTAEEMAEKGVLLAPLARQEANWISPMTKRELALLEDMGMLPEMPPGVQEYFEENGALHWTYDNQLSRLRKAEDTAAFLGFAEQVAALGQMGDEEGRQKLMQAFDRNFDPDRVVEMLADNAVIPARVKRTDEERAAYDEQASEDSERQALLEAVPVIADAAKNAAAAGAGGLG